MQIQHLTTMKMARFGNMIHFLAISIKDCKSIYCMSGIKSSSKSGYTAVAQTLQDCKPMLGDAVLCTLRYTCMHKDVIEKWHVGLQQQNPNKPMLHLLCFFTVLKYCLLHSSFFIFLPIIFLIVHTS